jgi:hypothetical protein
MKELKKFRTKDVSYTFQAPNGVAGDVTRTDESNVEPVQLIQDSVPQYPQAFGIALVAGTGGFRDPQTGDTAASFAGVLVREVPSIAGPADQGQFSPTIPNPNVPNGMLVRGYISVLCTAGTPARNGVVYMQVTANGASHPVGSFRADGTDSGNAVALSNTQASWASDGLDSANNAELRVAR